MNCQRFENVVSDVARDQMMEADVRAEALAHTDECQSCLARFRDEETLTRGLQLLAAEMQTMAAPAEMELSLREAFRRRQVVVPIAVMTPIAKGSERSRYWLVAAAAALLAVMSVAAMWWRSQTPQQTIANTPPRQQVSVPFEKPSRQGVDLAENPPPKQQAPKPVRHNTVRSKSSQPALANHVQREIATDFMSLGDMNPASLQDGGQIIRVQLRRSALMRFGFPVNMDRYNENVKADVIVGVDGLARAIRFVQ